MNLFDPTQLLFLLVIALLLFGAKKIPELVRGVLMGVSELQRGLDSCADLIRYEIEGPKVHHLLADWRSRDALWTLVALVCLLATLVPIYFSFLR